MLQRRLFASFPENPADREKHIVAFWPRMKAVDGVRAKQPDSIDRLKTAYRDGDLVVCVEDGSVWKPPAFDSSYRQLLKRRNLDGPTFHALRHSHASHLLRSGVNAKVISERLGHSKVSFTLERYAHLLNGMQEEAASKIEDAMKTAREKIHPKHVS